MAERNADVPGSRSVGTIKKAGGRQAGSATGGISDERDQRRAGSATSGISNEQDQRQAGSATSVANEVISIHFLCLCREGSLFTGR